MKADKGAAPSSPPLPKGPNCWECRYMAVTWDVRMPYGCKLMGFRSKVVPSIEVLRTDGRFCGGFSAKDQAQLKPIYKTNPKSKQVETPTATQNSRKNGIKILV
jgi:hypothetical protein